MFSQLTCTLSPFLLLQLNFSPHPRQLSLSLIFYFQQHSVIQAEQLSSTLLTLLSETKTHTESTSLRCRLNNCLLKIFRNTETKSKQIMNEDLSHNPTTQSFWHVFLPVKWISRMSPAVDTTSTLKVENLQIRWKQWTDGNAWHWPKFLPHTICFHNHSHSCINTHTHKNTQTAIKSSYFESPDSDQNFCL